MLASRYLSKPVSSSAFSRVQRLYSTPSSSGTYKVETTTEDNGTSTTVLENGIKIIQLPRENDTCVAVGLYVATGSANETHQTHGSAHYLRRFVYKGTNRQSGLRFTRSIQHITSHFEASNGRENIVYKATCHPGHVPDLAELLADVLRPRLAEWEFLEVKQLVANDIQLRKEDLIASLSDKIRHTAFRGVGLGRSPLCPEYNLNQIYPENLADYILNNVHAENISLVIAGQTPFEQETLLKNLATTFAGFPKNATGSSSGEAKVESKYYGGEFLEAGGPTNVYAEAYQGAAVSNSKEFLAQQLLTTILGDASSAFQLPGSRLTSRLAKAQDLSGVSQISSFNSYESQTLFGIRAIGSGSIKSLGEAAHRHLASLGESKVSQEEFDRARNVLKTRSNTFADTRYGFLNVFKVFSDYASFEKALDGVTVEDLQTQAKKILSGPRTTVQIGDLSNLPSFK